MTPTLMLCHWYMMLPVPFSLFCSCFFCSLMLPALCINWCLFFSFVLLLCCRVWLHLLLPCSLFPASAYSAPASSAYWSVFWEKWWRFVHVSLMCCLWTLSLCSICCLHCSASLIDAAWCLHCAGARLLCLRHLIYFLSCLSLAACDCLNLISLPAYLCLVFLLLCVLFSHLWCDTLYLCYIHLPLWCSAALFPLLIDCALLLWCVLLAMFYLLLCLVAWICACALLSHVSVCLCPYDLCPAADICCSSALVLQLLLWCHFFFVWFAWFSVDLLLLMLLLLLCLPLCMLILPSCHSDSAVLLQYCKLVILMLPIVCMLWSAWCFLSLCLLVTGAVPLPACAHSPCLMTPWPAAAVLWYWCWLHDTCNLWCVYDCHCVTLWALWIYLCLIYVLLLFVIWWLSAPLPDAVMIHPDVSTALSLLLWYILCLYSAILTVLPLQSACWLSVMLCMWCMLVCIELALMLESLIISW